MYETTFGFKGRPFTVSPSSTCFFQATEHQNALDELLVTISSLNGISILTGDAGTGKTAICQQIISRLEHEFQIQLVDHCNFPTVRALLQTLVYGLTGSYEKASEQELRLALKTEIHSSYLARHQPMLVIVDEAHLLNDQFLEELRVLSDISVDGQQTLQLLLSGQTALEETLFLPSLSSLNQRIGCQVFLDRMTREESEQYIQYRLDRVATDDRTFFTEDAIKLITQVSDGLPRCLNQICDHGLMIAFLQDSPIVDEAITREAFHDLQQLPLHWNDPLPASSPLEEIRNSRHSEESEQTTVETFSKENEVDHEIDTLMDERLNQLADESSIDDVGLVSDELDWDSEDIFSLGDGIEAIEIGSELEEESSYEDVVNTPQLESESLADQTDVVNLESLDTSQAHIDQPATDGFTEIIDRYAAIDAGIDPTTLPQVDPKKSEASSQIPQLQAPQFGTSTQPAKTVVPATKMPNSKIEQAQSSEYEFELDTELSESSDLIEAIDQIDKVIPESAESNCSSEADPIDLSDAQQNSKKEDVYQALAQEMSMGEDCLEGLLASQVYEVCSETRQELLNSLNDILRYSEPSEVETVEEESSIYDVVLPEEVRISEPDIPSPQNHPTVAEQEDSASSVYRLDSRTESEQRSSATSHLKGPAFGRYKNLFSRLRRKQGLS